MATKLIISRLWYIIIFILQIARADFHNGDSLFFLILPLKKCTFNFYIIVPSPVQEALLAVVEDFINVTWSPPAVPNGVIYQYIVKQVNPNDTSYYHVSGNEHSVLLPFSNITRIFISAVNLYGYSTQEFVTSSRGMEV